MEKPKSDFEKEYGVIDTIKDKYKFILGCTLFVIALSNFKEEFQRIPVNLGYIHFSLYIGGFCLVCGLAICTYLYILGTILQYMKLEVWKATRALFLIADRIFYFLMFLPMVIAINALFYQLWKFFGYTSVKEIVPLMGGILSSIIGAVVSLLVSNRIAKIKLQNLKMELKVEEVINLEKASRLLDNGYYSHSILECFEILETYLYRALINNKVYPPRDNISYILKLALQKNILEKSDLNGINELRTMRNSVVNLNVEHTKNQAQYALDFVKKLRGRNSGI